MTLFSYKGTYADGMLHQMQTALQFDYGCEHPDQVDLDEIDDVDGLCVWRLILDMAPEPEGKTDRIIILGDGHIESLIGSMKRYLHLSEDITDAELADAKEGLSRLQHAIL